jgi:NADH:ubiquinone oxidoreductase subunit 5 (subunit L)/multisubunit Na+/H+ antiporter MnhA subunit
MAISYFQAEFLPACAPAPPLLAALFIGAGIVAGRLRGEADERLTSRLALRACVLSLALSLAALAATLAGALPKRARLGTWLKSGDYRIDLSFELDSLSLGLSALFALLAALTVRFSIHCLHREAGFHRYFLILSLFAGAMQLLVLAGNAALAFVGWELAGVCSYLLIAYNYDRPIAALNATRAFVTNRIGDAGFVLGIFLAFAWTGGIDWPRIDGEIVRLEEWRADALACCFLLAAIAKSAQFPLTPWAMRAMEGPTPSSAIFYGAVMIHAGAYLVLRLQPLFEQAPLAMSLMAALGLATALYGFFCGLAQTDVKSALIFSVVAQVGLMFFAAGLGFWRLALVHLHAHAIFRAYQFLAAPSLMHQILGAPARPVPALLGRWPALYTAALQRLWLENLGDWLLVKPVQRLGADLRVFEHEALERVFGPPARDAAVSLPARPLPERGPGVGAPNPAAIRVSGLPGALLGASAHALHWFEEKLVLQGVGQGLIVAGRRLGVRLNRIEEMLNQPRFLVVLIIATLLLAF